MTSGQDTVDPDEILLDEVAEQTTDLQQDIVDAADQMEAGAEEVQDAFDEEYG